MSLAELRAYVDHIGGDRARLLLHRAGKSMWTNRRAEWNQAAGENLLRLHVCSALVANYPANILDEEWGLEDVPAWDEAFELPLVDWAGDDPVDPEGVAAELLAALQTCEAGPFQRAEWLVQHFAVYQEKSHALLKKEIYLLEHYTGRNSYTWEYEKDMAQKRAIRIHSMEDEYIDEIYSKLTEL